MHGENQIKKIVILGGGSAGWMTAAMLSKTFPSDFCEIMLVESEEIGTVAVGEATIPQIIQFNQVLGIDENEFIQATNATFKLGIDFVNWGQIGDSYIHPFGSPGTAIGPLPFYHYWLKLHKLGLAGDLNQYSIEALAAREGRFMRPANIPNSPLGKIAYAFHFDATLYAKFLRDYALKKGVTRIEGKVDSVSTQLDSGFINELCLHDGKRIEGDLFIDCSGFKGLLINKVMQAEYTDWSKWLPCDSAVVAPCKIVDEISSHTRSTAHSSGWQWRIPLQNRIGNGCVFSSQFMDKAQAKEQLVSTMEAEPEAEPRYLSWKSGIRRTPWVKNCVAIGLSAGFVEPLESTGLHTIQNAISKLIVMFPTKEFNQTDIDAYNKVSTTEFERIRDFIILHYKMTNRDDSDFWNYCRTMQIPDTLKEKIELYKTNGRFWRQDSELFGEHSWNAVFNGQGFQPEQPHPLADIFSQEKLVDEMQHIKMVLDNAVTRIPKHIDYINKFCKV